MAQKEREQQKKKKKKKKNGKAASALHNVAACDEKKGSVGGKRDPDARQKRLPGLTIFRVRGEKDQEYVPPHGEKNLDRKLTRCVKLLDQSRGRGILKKAQ